MRTHRPILWTVLSAVALVSASLPAYAGVTIDPASPSIGACPPPINAASILSQVLPAAGCPVPEVFAASYGLIGAADNVDGLSANTLTPASDNYIWVFSGDRASLGQAGTPYRGEAVNNQAASDLWRTQALTNVSPAAVVGAACGAPATIMPPPPVQHRVQTDYRLIPFLPTGAFFAGFQDNIDDFDLEDFDTTGDRVHDIRIYFSLDVGSPSLGAGSGADIFHAAAGAFFGPFSISTDIGLGSGNELDALVMWDRGVLGVMDPGQDIAVFSLAPGSTALNGPDAVAGTADDLSPADLLDNDFNGFFCIYIRPGQLAMRQVDNIDGLDVIHWEDGGGPDNPGNPD
jgi:hypothetical protein